VVDGAAELRSPRRRRRHDRRRQQEEHARVLVPGRRQPVGRDRDGQCAAHDEAEERPLVVGISRSSTSCASSSITSAGSHGVCAELVAGLAVDQHDLESAKDRPPYGSTPARSYRAERTPVMNTIGVRFEAPAERSRLTLPAEKKT
jgi:hypothetical protein